MLNKAGTCPTPMPPSSPPSLPPFPPADTYTHTGSCDTLPSCSNHIPITNPLRTLHALYRYPSHTLYASPAHLKLQRPLCPAPPHLQTPPALPLRASHSPSPRPPTTQRGSGRSAQQPTCQDAHKATGCSHTYTPFCPCTCTCTCRSYGFRTLATPIPCSTKRATPACWCKGAVPAAGSCSPQQA